MSYTKEEWKPIKNYEGLYEISNKGRVKALPKKVKRGTGFQMTNTQIRVTHLGKRGYERITLTKNNKKKNHCVHRLVAEAFIPNPDNLSDVNHKNEVKHHNHVENLEWCTHKHNCNHGTSPKRISEKLSKRVIQRKLNGEVLGAYPSVSAAARWTGISKGNISSVCLGRYTQAGGYKWEYM